ncbi:MAG: hypothetical protein NVS3B3_03140 [Aquirhabdus sp.]
MSKTYEYSSLKLQLHFIIGFNFSSAHYLKKDFPIIMMNRTKKKSLSIVMGVSDGFGCSQISILQTPVPPNAWAFAVSKSIVITQNNWGE